MRVLSLSWVELQGFSDVADDGKQRARTFNGLHVAKRDRMPRIDYRDSNTIRQALAQVLHGQLADDFCGPTMSLRVCRGIVSFALPKSDPGPLNAVHVKFTLRLQILAHTMAHRRF
jgi:hypothetical protein